MPTNQNVMRSVCAKSVCWRNTDDLNEVILLFEASDPDKAMAFTRGADLPARMQNAGVIDQPDIYFLE